MMSATALARNVKSCLSAAVTHDLTSTVLGTNTSKNYLKPSHESSIGYFMRSVFSLLRYIMNQYDNFTFCVIDSLDSQSLKWKRPFLELRLDFASPGIGPRPFTICSFCMLAMATPKKKHLENSERSNAFCNCSNPQRGLNPVSFRLRKNKDGDREVSQSGKELKFL